MKLIAFTCILCTWFYVVWTSFPSSSEWVIVKLMLCFALGLPLLFKAVDCKDIPNLDSKTTAPD